MGRNPSTQLAYMRYTQISSETEQINKLKQITERMTTQGSHSIIHNIKRTFSVPKWIANSHRMQEHFVLPKYSTFCTNLQIVFVIIFKYVLSNSLNILPVSELSLIVQAETTVINQCKQLLSPSADPTYVTTYISHSFPQHRHYLCAGAWILMHGHPENINSANLV